MAIWYTDLEACSLLTVSFLILVFLSSEILDFDFYLGLCLEEWSFWKFFSSGRGIELKIPYKFIEVD